MEETSKFYRCIYKIRIRLLQLVGLLPAEDRFSFLVMLGPIYINFCFWEIDIDYVYVFIKDCLLKRFSPNIVSELISFLGFHCRFMYIFSRRKKLFQMLRYSEDLWTDIKSEEKIHVRSFVRKAGKLHIMYSGIILTTISLYVLSSQLPQILDKTNGTEPRYLPYPWFFDVQNSPKFEILMVSQITCLVSMTQVSVCVDMTIAFLIMIASGHLRLIQVRLGAIAQDIKKIELVKNKISRDNVDYNLDVSHTNSMFEETDFKIMKRLKNCIQHHQEILIFCNDIAKISSEFLMIQLITTTYNISFMLFLLAGNIPVADKLKFLMVCLILTLQLFITQYPPEILLQESIGVADAAYIVPLFRDTQLRIDKLLIILIMRAQVPFQLLAGGQVQLSMMSFGNMIKGAVSFFTVLRGINN